jgi:hypothetical protein
MTVTHDIAEQPEPTAETSAAPAAGTLPYDPPVAIGWALPLFGVPLAAFLIIDAILGGVRQRRRAAIPTSPAPVGR